MTEEQAQELTSLAETVAHYMKALCKHGVPMEVAGQLACDWQRAYIQDEVDRRARGRHGKSPFRHVALDGTEFG